MHNISIYINVECKFLDSHKHLVILKRYFDFNSGDSIDQIFTLLDTVQNETEDVNEKLMNNSDMEFIAPDEIKLTDNPDNANVLMPDAYIYVVNKNTTLAKELETNKNSKKPEENTPIAWQRNVSPHS